MDGDVKLIRILGLRASFEVDFSSEHWYILSESNDSAYSLPSERGKKWIKRDKEDSSSCPEAGLPTSILVLV